MFKQPATSPQEPLLVNIREAAKLLNVSQRTIWQLCNDGAISAVKIGKRGVRYSYKSLMAFADKAQCPPPQG